MVLAMGCAMARIMGHIMVYYRDTPHGVTYGAVCLRYMLWGTPWAQAMERTKALPRHKFKENPMNLRGLSSRHIPLIMH